MLSNATTHSHMLINRVLNITSLTSCNTLVTRYTPPIITRSTNQTTVTLASIILSIQRHKVMQITTQTPLYILKLPTIIGSFVPTIPNKLKIPKSSPISIRINRLQLINDNFTHNKPPSYTTQKLAKSLATNC